MQFSNWLTQWIALRSAGLAPRTVDQYHDLVARYIAPAIGTVSVDNLTPDQVSGLLASICADGHTRTAQLVYVLLRAALADAVRCGRLARSPVDQVLRPRHYAQPRAYLAAEDLSALICWCLANPGVYSRAWLLACLLGLRRGEIAGLRWQDVDLRGQVIHIRQQRQPGADPTPPKSRAGVRDLPIPAPLLPVLRAARSVGYVVPVDAARLDRQLPVDLAAAGVPRVSLHGLRHSMATAAMQSGCNLRVLQSILGHTSPSTTAAIYVHVCVSDQLQALDTMARSMLH